VENEPVTLPLVDFDTTLRDAFETMRRAHRSGVIALRADAYYLFLAPDIVVAIATGTARTLADLHAPEVHIGPKRVTELPTNLVVRGIRGIAAEAVDWLRHQMRDYGVLSASPDAVEVMASFEALRTELESSPRDCYCVIGREPVPNGTTGGNCHRPVHGAGTVHCVK
jgi:hypothetical protein